MYKPDWVVEALEIAAGKLEPVGWEYVVGILRRFQRGGGRRSGPGPAAPAGPSRRGPTRRRTAS